MTLRNDKDEGTLSHSRKKVDDENYCFQLLLEHYLSVSMVDNQTYSKKKLTINYFCYYVNPLSVVANLWHVCCSGLFVIIESSKKFATVPYECVHLS